MRVAAMPPPNHDLATGHATHAAGSAAEACGGTGSSLRRPLTAGAAVLTALLSVCSLCAAGAVDDPRTAATAWLRAIGVTLLMLGGLYRVGTLEKKGVIHLTRWLRILLIAWIVLGPPGAVGLYAHFRYVPSALWGGPSWVLAVIAIPLGVAATVTLTRGQGWWIEMLLGVLYAGLALGVCFFVGLIVAAVHGDAL